MLLRILLLSVVFYSCTGQRMVQTDLYFGQRKPDGGMVSEKEWNEFVENYISKVFIQGSTVVKANGSWFDTSAKKLTSESLRMFF